MYNAKIEISQGLNPNEFKIIDASLGSETPTRRYIILTNVYGDVVQQDFKEGIKEILISGLKKDFAFKVEFKAIVSNPLSNSNYEYELDFALTGYADRELRKRQDYLKNCHVYDKRRYVDESTDIIYFINAAQNAIRFCDLAGAQEILDGIRALTNNC